ncbi:hypothetical protein ALQ64_01965 [Pseudomonas cannabina]|uniref:Uncharacterized protein n=1 Tax=Pseudomonas cannabina TaxID=86840 RepID=A0A3M3LS03_PSECA|nr:hypothetical protein ALQ64_01965 [Pseudomonas cannabina]
MAMMQDDAEQIGRFKVHSQKHELELISKNRYRMLSKTTV